ncbi:DUF4307 domain-containing protein [Cellulomonas soli]|uniref:DUF4307 domain-containing protein n=1 Tax=Cellulomonas soli TaxID=931535 RepID=UPI003F8779FB
MIDPPNPAERTEEDLVDTALPAGRYGTAPTQPSARLRAWRAVGIAAAAVVLVAFGVWMARGVFEDPVQWKTVGYHVGDATSTDVTFDVTKDTGVSVTCRVQALSESYGEVGVRTVEVGPGDERTQRVTATVRTTGLAVSATVLGCEPVDD